MAKAYRVASTQRCLTEDSTHLSDDIQNSYSLSFFLFATLLFHVF